MLAPSLSSLALAAIAAAATTALAADPPLEPSVLAQKSAGEPAALAAEVRGTLAAAGFQEAGSYEPYPGAIVIAVTSDELKAAAAGSKGGAYAAAQRVTRFDEPSDIASFGSHEQALESVEAGLTAGRGGAQLVCRIDVPGTEETVFGVALSDLSMMGAHSFMDIRCAPDAIEDALERVAAVRK